MSLANMLQPQVSRLAAEADEAGWRAMRSAWTMRGCLLALVYGDICFAVLPRLHLPESLAGQSVLDVGCWDGFYSFDAERRGARRRDRRGE